MKKKMLIGCLVAMSMLSLAGCGKGDKGESLVETGMQVEEQVTEAPEDYVDNSADKYAYTDEEMYASFDENRIAVHDEQIFADGIGFQYRFTTNLISTDPNVSPDTNKEAISIDSIKDHVENIVLGNKTYSLNDICKDSTAGLEVVKMFAEDFGVNIYDENGVLIERKGNITDEAALREAYSQRSDFENYSVCAYYFDAKMNSFDEETYQKYRDLYREANGTDTSTSLDGTLAVLLYYDTTGHDYFYTIVVTAPSYYDSEENFKANMNVANVRTDITNCRMIMDNGINIGFVNNMAIQCSK